MRKKYVLGVFVTALFAAALLSGPIMSDVEQASYKVVKSDGNIEIRDYAPMIMAMCEVSGERKAAIGDGFRIIASYIFGNNIGNNTIAMTSPVMQETGQKIAMTAPVTQQGDGDRWTVGFVMPSHYTMDSLPKPVNQDVKLIEVPRKRYAAIRFSGLGSDDALKQREGELRSYLDQHHYMPIGLPTYAFFNPPWTVPFLRRNEVMLEIQ
jgi:hypothetical protein